ncbi:MAG TPA: iron-sulfur cluster assembly scaffold protein [Verrucomicrobiae bacterium]|nr:iron-sulfur cluster assembly scaffold protein [Verrucomicrobiae bacterium]
MLNDKILMHFHNPQNAGDLPAASHVSEVANPVCGDIMRLAIRLDSGKIAEARFKTQGCVASIAAGSVLTCLLLGKTPSDARAITPQEISALLDGLPPASFHAAQLCVDAISAVLGEED